MFSGLFEPMHLIVILGIVLIIFGPGKLPEIGSELGKAIKGFKKAVADKPFIEAEQVKIETKCLSEKEEEKL